MRIRELFRPEDLNQAYERLVSTKGAVVMAGGMFLRLQKRHFPLMIDLTGLGLEGIQILGNGQEIEIGAMTCLRDIEKNDRLPAVLREAMLQIGGVSLRNMATIGGSVMGKYPFSDVITALLALDASLHFHKAGRVKLAVFMEMDRMEHDILTKIVFERPKASAYKTYKNVYVDFALLNVGVALKADHKYSVSIGARPGHAKQAFATSLDDPEAVLDSFEFDDNIRASGDYRRALAKAFLEDLREEEALWK